MRCQLTINLSTLKKNYESIKNYLKKPIIAVVKSNAYGHGIIPITKTLISLGVKSFIVATIEEALILRSTFNQIQIILLEPCENFQLMYSNRITPSIGSINYLKKLIATNLSFPIHLKIETGLNRLGIIEDELEECIRLINKSKVLIKGIYTHISSEENYQHQYLKFKKALSYFESLNNVMIHINSSHYIFENQLSTHYRIGLALFGLEKHPLIELKPLITLKAPIYRVKKVFKNESVGYHNQGKITCDGYLYTIPLGYADGWLPNRKTIGYYSSYLKQVGNTCMDLMMLFSNEYIPEGKYIEIISESISIFDLSIYYDESLYQIVTMLSPRINRIYTN